MDFPSPRVMRNSQVLLEPPRLWYLMTASQTKISRNSNYTCPETPPLHHSALKPAYKACTLWGSLWTSWTQGTTSVRWRRKHGSSQLREPTLIQTSGTWHPARLLLTSLSLVQFWQKKFPGNNHPNSMWTINLKKWRHKNSFAKYAWPLPWRWIPLLKGLGSGMVWPR